MGQRKKPKIHRIFKICKNFNSKIQTLVVDLYEILHGYLIFKMYMFPGAQSFKPTYLLELDSWHPFFAASSLRLGLSF